MRRAAARSQCANNLKQIAIGLHDYADTHRAGPGIRGTSPFFPAGTVVNPALPPERRLSWLVEVLPFVEQIHAYQGIDLTVAWDAPTNTTAVRTPITVFQCPDWSRETVPSRAFFTPYPGVAGVGVAPETLPAADRNAGIFGYDRRTLFSDVVDGTSNTLLILETARANGPWAQGGPATVRGLDPADRPYLGAGRPFGGTHFAENTILSRGVSIGCSAAMADGSVRFLRETIEPQILEGMATIAGNEEVAQDW